MTDPKPDGMPVLELRDVSTHYGPIQVLRDVDVQVWPGEIVCLLGGNASGKATTLKTILGYVVPSKGDVLLDGERVEIQEADSYRLELEDLAAAIRGEREPLLGREDALGQARTIDRLYASAESGSPA